MLQNLHHRRRRPSLRLRNQKMNVFRHHHIPNQQKLITRASLLQNFQKHVPFPRCPQQRTPPVATASNEMQMPMPINPLQFFAHRMGLSRQTSSPCSQQPTASRFWGCRIPLRGLQRVRGKTSSPPLRARATNRLKVQWVPHPFAQFAKGAWQDVKPYPPGRPCATTPHEVHKNRSNLLRIGRATVAHPRRRPLAANRRECGTPNFHPNGKPKNQSTSPSTAAVVSSTPVTRQEERTGTASLTAQKGAPPAADCCQQLTVFQAHVFWED